MKVKFEDMFGNPLNIGDFVIVTTIVKTHPFIGLHKILSFSATGIRTVGFNFLPEENKCYYLKRSFKKMIKLNPYHVTTFERLMEKLDND